jgi:hypothetical protein
MPYPGEPEAILKRALEFASKLTKDLGSQFNVVKVQV